MAPCPEAPPAAPPWPPAPPPPAAPIWSWSKIICSSASGGSLGLTSTSSKTCMPDLPSKDLETSAPVSFRGTPSTRVMTSPGLRSTAMALRGESGAPRMPDVSKTRTTSMPRSVLRRLPPRHALGSPTGSVGASDRMDTNTCSTESSPSACWRTSRRSLLVLTR